MHKNPNYATLKLGIIGGGQLGRMIAMEAKKMGFHVTVLDPTKNPPAAQTSDIHIVGGFYDAAKLQALVTSVDVTTFELEHIEISGLKELEKAGHTIYPSPNVMELIQNKYEQKKMLHESGIPVPAYKDVQSIVDLESFGFPVIQKTKKEGYDGKGVLLLKSKDDTQNAIKADSFIEELVEIDKELAIMIARSHTGELSCYPVVEMLFDERTNMCDIVLAPANISKALEQKAIEVSQKAIEVLGGVGIFAVELFLTKNGEVLVNEIAPRPHNSGHYTLEACATSQFEQLVRTVTHLPLGETKLINPAVMVNLVGEEGYGGTPQVEGLDEALAIDGLHYHLYGKAVTKPFRKMGHFTVVHEDVTLAQKKALEAKALLKVKGEKTL